MGARGTAHRVARWKQKQRGPAERREEALHTKLTSMPSLYLPNEGCHGVFSLRGYTCTHTNVRELATHEEGVGEGRASGYKPSHSSTLHATASHPLPRNTCTPAAGAECSAGGNTSRPMGGTLPFPHSGEHLEGGAVGFTKLRGNHQEVKAMGIARGHGSRHPAGVPPVQKSCCCYRLRFLGVDARAAAPAGCGGTKARHLQQGARSQVGRLAPTHTPR